VEFKCETQAFAPGGSKEAYRVDIAVRTGLANAHQSISTRKPRVTSAVYLRAAHAYMLISMPTGTSTILGAFQAIVSLLTNPDDARP